MMNPISAAELFSERFFTVLPRISRWIAVLDGFFDETGTHGGAEITGVAGFLYSKEGLLRFETEWLKRTADLSEPFHTVECVAQRGQFAAWPRDECTRLLRDLANLIVRTRDVGFISTVTQKDFYDYVGQNPKIRRYIGSPYSLCLISCLQNMGTYAKERAESVNFWFEAGNERQKEAAEFVHMIYRDQSLRDLYAFGSHSFIPKSGNPALVSADFLAWEWQRQWREIEAGSETWREMFEIIRSDNDRPLFIEHITRNSIGVLARAHG